MAHLPNPLDSVFAALAVEAASKDPRSHKVGAVLVKDNQVVGEPTWGAKIAKSAHAEQTLLDLTLFSTPIQGATLYVTLEPCMRSRHWTASKKYQTCAEIIVDRGISRVVVGMPDPDKRIHARGVELLAKEGITVDWFPDSLREECERLNQGWMEEKKREWTFPDMFFSIEATASKVIRPYPGLKVGYALTLQQAPVDGWRPRDVRVVATSEQWDLDSTYEPMYRDYLTKNTIRLAHRRGDLCHMLIKNPVSFSDATNTVLQVGSTKYTYAQFYKDVILSDDGRPADENLNANVVKSRLIDRLVKEAEQRADFPHSLCAHVVVLTSDQYILITQRSPKVHYHPLSWSCSIEEQINERDLSYAPEAVAEAWLERALWEELALTPKHFDLNESRLMSVLLEGDILNIAVCMIAVLRIPRDELSEIIRTRPKTDWEFIAWDYLAYRDDVLVPEIVWPRMPNHPTWRYRLMMALLKKNGLPSP